MTANPLSGPSRRSMRLVGHDYRQPGAYFVTICSFKRMCLFGDIDRERFLPNEFGNVVIACWEAIPKHHPDVDLDAYVLMPNHLHGIVSIEAPEPTEQPGPRTKTDASEKDFPKGATPGALGAIVGSFKAAVTREIGKQMGMAGTTVWQRGYYDHIIRGERALDRIRNYIQANPSRWPQDEENPTNIGRNPPPR